MESVEVSGDLVNSLGDILAKPRAAPDKPRNLIDVIEWCRRRQLPADVVGRWVWIRFDSKPGEAVRAELKSAGFRWCAQRGEWAHNCGHPSKRGHVPPRLTYGEVPVSEFALLESAGAP